MPIPLIGVYFLLGVIGILFFIGISRYNVNASLAFVVFASVLMLSTSMFIMNEGVQLDNVSSIDPETLEYSYETISYEVNTWNWIKILTDTLFWGSFVGIIFGFAWNFNKSKQIQKENDEWAM